MEKKIILNMINICKSFPGVVALDNVNFSLQEGEIHAIVGENGAGKSTLLKILSGYHRKDSGQIFYKGEEINVLNNRQARQFGISIIPQEIELIPSLNVAENIFMGHYPRNNFGFIKWDNLYPETKKYLKKFGMNNVSEKSEVSNLSAAQKKIIEILKAMSFKIKILALDEPTSSLTEDETEKLFGILRDLKNEGISIIYVSHRLREIFQISDRITVLKDGKYIDTINTKDTNPNELISKMVGREVEDLFDYAHRSNYVGNDVILEVKNLSKKGILENISLTLRKGEILGLSGLIGAGRTEFARAIFGADRIDSGEIIVDGKKVNINNCEDAVKNGLGFAPEDRHREGLILTFSVKENMTFPFLKKISKGFFINQIEEKNISKRYIDALNIKTPSEDTIVSSLSGGNQQKVSISKWLAANSKILILDEPTCGIDVGAKAEVYSLIHQLANNGIGIIMISSDLLEVMNISDRILVFCNGRITGEFKNPRNATEQEIMSCAVVK